MLGALYQASQGSPAAQSGTSDQLPEVTVSGQAQPQLSEMIIPDAPATSAASPPPSVPTVADAAEKMRQIPRWKWYVPGFAQGFAEMNQMILGRLALMQRQQELQREQAYATQTKSIWDNWSRPQQGQQPGQPVAPQGAVPPPGAVPASPQQPGPISTGAPSAPPAGPVQTLGAGGITGQPLPAGVHGTLAGPMAGPAAAAAPVATPAPAPAITAPSFDQSGAVPSAMLSRAESQGELQRQLAGAAFDSYLPAEGMARLKSADEADQRALELVKTNAELVGKRADTVTGSLVDVMDNTQEGTPERAAAYGRALGNIGRTWGQTGLDPNMPPTDENLHSAIMGFGGLKAEAAYRKDQGEMRYREAATRTQNTRNRLIDYQLSHIAPLQAKRLEKVAGGKGVTNIEKSQRDVLNVAIPKLEEMKKIMDNNPNMSFGGLAGAGGFYWEEIKGHVVNMQKPRVRWNTLLDELKPLVPQIESYTGRMGGPSIKLSAPLTDLYGALQGGDVTKEKVQDLLNDFIKMREINPAYQEDTVPKLPDDPQLNESIRQLNILLQQTEPEAPQPQAASQ